MRWNTEFYLLAFLGAILIALPVYTELGGMDLTRHSLVEYLDLEFKTSIWWTIVGIPLLAGIAFLAAALQGLRIRPSGRTTVWFFVGCEVFAVALLLIGGYGILATVFCGLLLVYVALKYRKTASP